ncbi:MAG: translation initiation factor IF-5A [DPANN group archaeon]|nr:translation initiation factor IF-5A [DPANN group archaeon]
MDIKREDVTQSSIRPGKYILIEGRPFEITNADWSAPGKHGHAKCRITAMDLLTKGKKQIVYAAHDKIDCPIIERSVAQILAVQQNKAQAMNMETFETFELEIPEDLKDQIKEGLEIVYWDILGTKVIKQVRKA